MSTEKTYQSLSEIKNKYSKIHEGIDIHELNSIISETNDTLFTNLKEIIYSNQNVGGTSTESQVNSIFTDLNYKRASLDTKIANLTLSLTNSAQEKTRLNSEKRKLTRKLAKDKLDVVTEESSLRDNQRNKRVKEGEINVKRNEKTKKENERRAARDQADKDDLFNEINTLSDAVTNLTNEKEGVEFDIQTQSQKVRDMQNDIKETEKEVKQLEEKIKRIDDGVIDPTDQQTKLTERKDKVKKMEDSYNEFIDKGSRVFDTTKKISDQAIGVGIPGHYDANNDMFQVGATLPPGTTYTLYDGEGRSLINGVFKKLKLEDGTEIDIQGFSIIPGTGEIRRTNNIIIKRSDTGEEIKKFPLGLNIDIGVSVPVSGSLGIGLPSKTLDLTNRKTVKFKLTRSIQGGASLETIYDSVNARIGAPIDTQLNHIYDRKYDAVKKELIFKLLEDNAKDQFSKLTIDQKDVFIAGLVAVGYDMDKPMFQLSFKESVTKDDFTGTQAEFENQLLHNLDVKAEEKLKKILEERLDKVTLGSPTPRNSIISDFIDYFTHDVDIDKNQVRREGRYDAINTRTGGQITRQVTNIFDTKYNDTKKQVLLKLMEETNKVGFDKLSDKQKDEFITGLATIGYDMDDPTFQTEFKSAITKEDFQGTEDEFEKQLLQNFDTKAEEKLKKILEDRLDKTNIGGQKTRSVLTGKIMDFINNSTFDLPKRKTSFQDVERELDQNTLKIRLKQEFEHKFNKVQRDAFEKVLAANPEFAKLNQAQKDRLYERIQDLGTIQNGPVIIPLEKIPGTPPTPPYSIATITSTPSTHTYSVMPSNDDYSGFSTWLINQTPEGKMDSDSYREWLRNSLTASLDDGKTPYENFFADILKKFTDAPAVKTRLNHTLLDFINDTNTADHRGFEAELAGNLANTTPNTTYAKKRYQRLMPWVRGDAQNYLTFLSGQSDDFKNESITVGGKTFSYTGKFTIKGAQSVTASIKIGDTKERTFSAGSPVALIRSLLMSPYIEPPHARFHTSLSVIKSMTKLAHANGVLRPVALTADMLATLPPTKRALLSAHPNPMIGIDIDEKTGKLIASAYNLNLTTGQHDNVYKMFDEDEFVATQSVRDLRQGIEGLLAVTNHTMNNVYDQYRQARRGTLLQRALLRKYRYGGLRNMRKKLSFDGGSVSIGGKTLNVSCKDGLFELSGEGLAKPVKGRNLGSLLAYNPEFAGLELATLELANEKMLQMYQEKLSKQNRKYNYGVMDDANHRVYLLDKQGNLGYIDAMDQDFVSRRWTFAGGRSYGRIRDDQMPTGFIVMKEGNDIKDAAVYKSFLRNEALIGPMVKAMGCTHRTLAIRGG